MPHRSYTARRALALSAAALFSATALSGCYDIYGLSTDVDPSLRADADVDIDERIDEGVLPEAGLDGSTDGAVDGAIDGGIDAELPLPDGALVEPPEPDPPSPNACRTTPTIHPFEDPVPEFEWPSGPVVQSDSIHVSSTPLVIDLEPDGVTIEPEVVFVSYPPLRSRDGVEPPGVLRIWDPKADTTITHPPTEAEQGILEATTNIAAGDIDGDGNNEIVGLMKEIGTAAFRSDGTVWWTSNWPGVEDRGTRFTPIFSGAPAIADLEGDGDVEVIIGRTVLEGTTGNLLWQGPDEGGKGISQFFGPPLLRGGPG